jgi:hypothetical protein
MPDPAFLYFLAPFTLLWLAFAAAETARVVAAIRTVRR